MVASTSSPSPVFASVSPLDGSELPAVAPTPVDTLPDLVKQAREAQRAWAAKTPYERITIVRNVKDRVLDRAERIADTLRRELGKPEVEALLSEVIPSGDVVTYWCEAIEELLDPVDVPLDRLSYPGKRGAIHRDARGVVAVIMPWNYPVALPLRTIVPALLAGNAVLFKPSEVSPRAGAIVAELFDGLVPNGVFTLVQGGRETGEALVKQEGIDLVVFTGSVAAGRKVALACAERLVPCSLELGGKDAAIVLADCNVDRAAHGVVWGALTNAGQNCAAIERVYVEKPVAEAFRKKVVEVVASLRVGQDVGPLATEAQRAIVERHVEGAKAAGARVLAGGERPGGGEGAGYAYAPTIVELDADDVPLMQEETFGPVIPIATVESADEAVARANASRYGLTASVWTKKVARGEELAKKLRAGVVTINNHAFTGALPGAPWSGHGESGYGITSSPLALEALTRPRFVLVDTNRAARELWWYPYTDTLRTIALAFAVLRSGTTSIFAKIGAVFRLLGALPKRLVGGG